MNKMRTLLVGAVLAGAALRLFLVLRFPFSEAGDTKVYEALANNWLDHGVYGLWIAGRLTPVDIRMPGYPAFLAAVYAIFGRGTLPVLLQALVDLVGCTVIAALAARLAPRETRARVAIAALWLAALCPFIANYAAAPLTEVLATFLTGLALLVFAAEETLSKSTFFGWNELLIYVHPSGLFLLGGVIVGLGTLLRPETPLILVAAALVFLGRWRRGDWSRLTRSVVLTGLGLLLPLLPWAARNWRTFGEVQFLAPRYANLPSEFVPRGFYAWTKTWLWRFRDVYLAPWKLGDEPIRIEDLPTSTFDSPEERERVAALLEQYNEKLDITPELDREFTELARERTSRHALRTYLVIPLKRAGAIWFTPRVELLPFSGHLWPIGEHWQEDPVDFSVTVVFGLLSLLFVGLAVAGAWRCRHSPATGLLVVFILVRTALLTQVETPEPRYVLECFPAILALGAQFWAYQPEGRARR